MSRRVSTSNKFNKCCKICKDSGKSKSDYESHNIRNDKGLICCPTIKAHQCKKCFRSGHFEKYCTVMSTDSIAGINKFLHNIDKKPLKDTVSLKKVSKGRFSALDMDDISSDDDKKPSAATMDWAESVSDYDSDSDCEKESLSPNVTLRAHQRHW